MARVLAVALARPRSWRGARSPPATRRSCTARSRRPSPRLTGGRGEADLPRRTRRSPPGCAHYPRGPADRRDLHQGDEALDGQGLGRRRRARSRPARSTTRAARSPRRGPGRRWRGRWRAATTGAFGGQRDQQLAGLARLLRALPARARRPAPAAQPAQPRPARAALVLASRSGSSTAATSSRACRSPTRRSLYLLGRMVWSGVARPARRPAPCRSGRSGCSRPRPSSRRASGSGSTCAPRT